MILFRQSSAVLSRRVGPEVLLAPLEGEDFERLSETAASVWELLESPRTLSELIASLAPLYGVSAADISSDVERLVDELLRRGVIEMIGENGV
jgi:hypothetical protein